MIDLDGTGLEQSRSTHVRGSTMFSVTEEAGVRIESEREVEGEKNGVCGGVDID